MKDTIFAFNGQLIGIKNLKKDNFDVNNGTIFFMGIKLIGVLENARSLAD